jgi:hypothetical protein
LGSTVVRNPELYNIFVGGWNSNPTLIAARQALDQSTKSLSTDPSGNIVKEYGVGSSTFAGSDVVPVNQGPWNQTLAGEVAAQENQGLRGNNVQLTFSTAVKQALVPHLQRITDYLLQQGWQAVQPPLQKVSHFWTQEAPTGITKQAAVPSNRIYVIYLAPGMWLDPFQGGLGGYHFFNSDGTEVAIISPSVRELIANQWLDAGINFNGNPLDGWSIIASHEIAEAETDPLVGGGVVYANGDEIGDPPLNGALVPFPEVAQCGADHVARQVLPSNKYKGYFTSTPVPEGAVPLFQTRSYFKAPPGPDGKQKTYEVRSTYHLVRNAKPAAAGGQDAANAKSMLASLRPSSRVVAMPVGAPTGQGNQNKSG